MVTKILMDRDIHLVWERHRFADRNLRPHTTTSIIRGWLREKIFLSSHNRPGSRGVRATHGVGTATAVDSVERTQPSTERERGGGEEGSNPLGEFELTHGRCGQQGVREESDPPPSCIARARDRRTRTQRHELRRLPRRSLHAGGDHQPQREGYLGKHVQHEQEADVGRREHVRHRK